MVGVSREKQRDLLLLSLACATAALLLAPVLFRGWYPHDEGALGQSAERVLRGEIPHRDFDEIYTGLLSYWHALAFRIAGISSATLRLPLFAVTIVWTAALFRIARRFAPAWAAALLALLCVVWAVPNYPAPMPSWYNLFCATFGTLALLRWRETRQLRWLWLAGVAGGVSFLVKLSGLAFLIGAGLVLVHGTREDAEGDGPAAAASGGAVRSRGGALLVALGLADLLALLAIPLWSAGMRHTTRLWLPLALLGAALVVREWHAGIALTPRARALFRAFRPFLLGVLVPVGLWGAFLVAVGGVEATIDGVFVAPLRRLASAAKPPPPFSQLMAVCVLALFVAPRRTAVGARIATMLLIFGGGALIVGSATRYAAYRWVWETVWGFPALAAACGAAFILWRERSTGDRPDLPAAADPARAARAAAVVLACTAASTLLVEFPFAAPIYLLYSLPLAILALAATLRAIPGVPPRVQLTTLGLLLTFGVMRLYPATVRTIGYRYFESRETATLALPRSGLRVTAGDSAQYTDLVARLVALGPSRDLWAGPDAPEVYFLSGAPNRTRSMFDFLDAGPAASRTLATRVIASDASMIVLKMSTEFSVDPDSTDLATLRARYPHEERVDGFLVLWR